MANVARGVSALMCAVAAAIIAPYLVVHAQMGPNPYRPVEGLQAGRGPGRIGEAWAKLPGGRAMGSPGGLEIDGDGEHLWAAVRCGNDGTPRGSQTLLRHLRSGSDHQVRPGWQRRHGIRQPHVLLAARHARRPRGQYLGDRSGTAARSRHQAVRKAVGHQVFKFSPQGKLLMTLGEAGVSGNDAAHFTSPSDVVTAPNGDIFVADGHNANGNNRIVKYSKEGKFIKAFGSTGHGPGQLRGPHALAMDAAGGFSSPTGSNQRIVIFDQDGKYLTKWTQFGMPSDIAIDRNGKIYVADSESDMNENPGWEKGIRIGDVKTGWVEHFILDPGDNPPITAGGSGAESIAVDRHGNIFAGEPRPQRLQKYVKVR